MNETMAQNRRRERMVRKILRHAEIARFGTTAEKNQLELFGTELVRAEAPRGPQGKFRRQSRQLRYLVSDAYMSMFRVVPEDHVIVDPVRNREFIARCRELGAREPEEVLNRQLLNCRKAGDHCQLWREPIAPLSEAVIDRTSAAAELAGRMTQLMVASERGIEPSIDAILCTPGYRDIFDDYAQQLIPDFSVQVFRLVLLGFRKGSRQISDNRAGLAEYSACGRLEAAADNDDLAVPGVYRLRSGATQEFISWTRNLQCRLRHHLSVGDGRLLPERWHPHAGRVVEVDVIASQVGKRADFENAVYVQTTKQRPLWNIARAV